MTTLSLKRQTEIHVFSLSAVLVFTTTRRMPYTPLRADFPLSAEQILSYSQRTSRGYRCAFSTFTDFYINMPLPVLPDHSCIYRR